MISAKIIADSKNKFGDRLTTMVVTFPRIILAEVNTHRMFSRNSASSRAIPFEKMVKMVEENPFIPIKFMKDHSGMQGNEYFTDEEVKDLPLLERWLQAKDKAIENAKELSYYGLTKQIVNRLLEPFMWHTAIISATEWENFFALRNHEAAEIHLQELARIMMLAYNSSEPKLLKDGEWHIPFGDNIDEERLFNCLNGTEKFDDLYTNGFEQFKIKISTARCARVSYLNFEGKDDYEADLKLYDRLAEMGHFSPMEHCAKSMSLDERNRNYITRKFVNHNESKEYGWCANFKGFIQLRKSFENENRKDERVIKK